MRRKRAKPPRKARFEAKGAIVRKLSPEQPAARDEGPRLIPLGPAKDAGLGRIEHYLDLADKALGHPAVKEPEGAPQEFAPAHDNSDEPSSVDPAKEDPPVLPESALPPGSLPTPRPKLRLPKPASLPSPPKPPKLVRPSPPRAPRFPQPPKLSLPKPPRRKNHSS